MKRRRPRFNDVSPFPPLVLPEATADQIRSLAHELIRNCISDYEGFLQDARRVSPQRWSFLKQKGDLVMFLERQQQQQQRERLDSGIIPMLDFIHHPTLPASSTNYTKTRSANEPAVLCMGGIPGTLDDCMFGILNPTLREMGIRASYVNDLHRGAVLATLAEPTATDPFSSLLIKWKEIDVPLRHTKLIKNRDFVYVESTGSTTLQNGERVGYYLVHSVEFPQTCELSGRIRGNVSVCGIFRQQAVQSVEVYCTGVADPCGKLSKRLWRQLTMQTVLPVTAYVYCGQMKKLSWLVQKSYEVTRDQHPLKTGVCSSCSEERSFGQSSCTICLSCVCRRCTIHRTISFMTRDDRLVRRKLPFCAKCIHKAIKMSAEDTTRNQLGAQESDDCSDVMSINTSDEFFRTLRLL